MSITRKINYKERNQIQDFESSTRFYFNNILKKIYGMLIFRNLPETINETFLKQTLLLQGKIAFFENGGDLIALNCQYSDTPNLYYIPEKIIIANPVIGSRSLTIDKECKLVYCTETDVYSFSGFYGGLYPLIMRTAQQLADCDISINCYLKNTRVFRLVTADDENTKASAVMALQKLYDGETVAVADSNLIAKIQSLEMFGGTNTNVAQSLIDMKQYILAHFYHEIGLNTNDNMKRAHLLETEIDTNTNLVRANIQNIIETISQGIAGVNEHFGAKIEFELSDIYRQSAAENVTNKNIYDDNIIEGTEEAEAQTEEETETAAEKEAEAQTEEETEVAAEEETAAQTEEETETAAEEEAEAQTEEETEAAAEEEAEAQTEEETEVAIEKIKEAIEELKEVIEDED